MKSAVDHTSLKELLHGKSTLRVVGAHSALGAKVAQEAGFDAIWSSSFEVSAARGLPDASILTMTEYIEAARHMQAAVDIPVIADVDTGYGNNLNVAHMVREYERAGICAVCMEDKLFPKMNSFVDTTHSLLRVDDFTSKIRVVKSVQTDPNFLLIARTEALIDGLGIPEAIRRANAYVEAGADAILVHSKKTSSQEIEEFLDRWDKTAPVVIVPTTYPELSYQRAAELNIDMVIYANQGLRTVVRSLQHTFESIINTGGTLEIESQIAAVRDIFELQELAAWTELEAL